MENLLAVMMRLRNARNLDSRQTNAIDNAYFACRPPDKAASRRRKRSPMQVWSGMTVGQAPSWQAGSLPANYCTTVTYAGCISIRSWWGLLLTGPILWGHIQWDNDCGRVSVASPHLWGSRSVGTRPSDTRCTVLRLCTFRSTSIT
jgi:hypothetical protein